MSETWRWPVEETKITDVSRGYTSWHKGIDIITDTIEGKNVLASREGVVARVFDGCVNRNGYNAETGKECDEMGCLYPTDVKYYAEDGVTIIDIKQFCNDGIGNAVFIKHSDNLYSQYCHLKSFNVNVGDTVKRGQVIGKVGSSGESTDPHLHFSLSKGIEWWGNDRFNNDTSVIVYNYENDPDIPTPDTGGDGSGTGEGDGNTTKVPVTFKKNTQSDGGPVIETREYEVGKPYGEFPSAGTRTGYTFAGWWPEANSESSEFTVNTTVPAWDHSLYAHWSLQYFTVTVNANGGTGVVGSFTATNGVEYGEDFPGVPNKEGYDFKGWYADSGFTTPVSSTTVADISKKNIYAKWGVKTYALTLYPGYGANVQLSGTYKATTENAYGTALPTLTRCGYTHIGWKRSDVDGDTVVYNSGSIVTKEITKFTAIWKVKEVEVTYSYNYEENGETKKKVSTVNYGNTYATAWGTNVPNMDNIVHPTGGYDFAGWHHDEVEGSDKVVMDEKHTLTATWEPKEYTVSFVAGDSEFAAVVPEITVKYGQKYGCLPTPRSKDLYEFSHWEYSGEKCESSTEVFVTGYHTLTAHWNKVCLYNVYYEDSNGKSRKVSNTVNYGEPYVVPALTEKIGHDAKWVFSETDSPYDGTEFFPGMLASPDLPKTIIADYTAKLIRVTYDYCGGIDSDGYGDKIVNMPYNTTYGSQIFEKPGYTFTGWYYDEMCTQPVGSTDVITNPEPHTIYAGWKKNITLTFDPGDSTFAETVELKTVYLGEPYGDLPAPACKDPYIFSYWALFDESGNEVDYLEADKIVEIEEDHTAVAMWEKTRMLYLDPNGGTVSLSYRIATFGMVYPILPTPKKEGYDFVGWFFGNDTVYAGEQCTRELIAIPEHPDTVYAKWTPKNITVTFNGMGGSPVFGSYTHAYGSNYALPWATRTGYTFTGWFFDESCTEQCTVDNIVTNAEDHTLYAGWEGVEVNVYFKTVAGAIVSTKTVRYGESYGELPEVTENPGMQGYWRTSTNNMTAVEVTSDTIVTDYEAHSLYEGYRSIIITLKLYPNGGTWCDYCDDTRELTGVVVGDSYGYYLEDICRDGYTFVGWKLADIEGNIIEGSDYITEDTLITADYDHGLVAEWD